jgi:hypothetical protein
MIEGHRHPVPVKDLARQFGIHRVTITALL